MNLWSRRIADFTARPALVLAWLRIVLLAVMFISERVAGDQDGNTFSLLLLLAAVYAVGMLVRVRSSGKSTPRAAWTFATVDLVLVGALLATSGSAFPHLRFIFSAMPVVAIFLGRPRHTFAAVIASLIAYAAIELVRNSTGPNAPLDVTITQGLDLLFQGSLAVMLSVLLSRRNDQVSELADDRRRLVLQSFEAEERERKQLAYALHEEAVQSLLAAQLEFRRSGRGDAQALQRGLAALDRTVSELRSAIFELHPYTLDYAGLAAAVEDLGAQQAVLGQMSITTDVDPDAQGVRDRLVFSLVREFAINAVKHSRAAHVSVSVELIAEELLITVGDDGCGFEPERPRKALREGHIGLASSKERVEGLGGMFTIQSALGQGSVVRAVLPSRREEERPTEQVDPALSNDPRVKLNRRMSDPA